MVWIIKHSDQGECYYIRTFNCFPIYKVLVTNFSAAKLKVAIYVNDNIFLRIYLWCKYPGLVLYLFLRLVPLLGCRWDALIQRAFEEELSSNRLLLNHLSYCITSFDSQLFSYIHHTNNIVSESFFSLI